MMRFLDATGVGHKLRSRVPYDRCRIGGLVRHCLDVAERNGRRLLTPVAVASTFCAISCVAEACLSIAVEIRAGQLI